MAFVNDIEINHYIRLASQCIYNSGLWSNLLRKTATTTLHFQQNRRVHVKSVNSTGHNHDANFLTLAVIFI